MSKSAIKILHDDPVMIITRSLSKTTKTKNDNSSNELIANLIDQLSRTHCPINKAPESKSAIDKLKIKFEYKSHEQQIEINNFVSTWLSLQGISISSKQANLTHFTHGTKLYSKDESNQLCGSLKYHSGKHKVQLEITGRGCNYVNANKLKFSSLFAICKHLGGIVTYIDIAVDDFTGKFNIRDTKKQYSAGRYDPKRGKRPTTKTLNGAKGKTVYMGADSSYCRVRVYEKGKEQEFPIGSKENINWTRHETTLEGRKHHVIPLDVLLTPDPFFVGAYKAHARILKGVQPRCVYREATRSTVNSLCKSLAFNKHQWGKTNAVLADIIGNKEQALNLISRENEGVPETMRLPNYIDLDVIRAITEDEFNLSIATVIKQQMALHAPNRKVGA
ncbi:MAG: replication initiation factor domain-containing protein [Colwellia sp.]